jgi:hypothetical protein
LKVLKLLMLPENPNNQLTKTISKHHLIKTDTPLINPMNLSLQNKKVNTFAAT